MKKLWDNIRKEYGNFWRDDGHDWNQSHLSQADKRSLWYGAVLLCALTVLFTELLYSYHFGKIERQNEKNIEMALNRITAYAASATDDEYEAIARTIRQDLIYSDFSRDKENYIRYIPNTAQICRLYPQTFPNQVYLLCNNTGMLYGLDIFEDDAAVSGATPVSGATQASGDTPVSADTQFSGGTKVSGGYDNISEATLLITKMPGNKTGHARLDRTRGILSIQKMKSLFCDDCIRDIMAALDEYGTMNEFVIMDGKEKKFYPIKEGVLDIGDYHLELTYKDNGYDIAIQYSPVQLSR